MATSTAQGRLSGLDNDRMHQAAELLLKARRERMPLRELPKNLRPRDMAEAYALQDIMGYALQPLGGWKVGAPAPDATPLYCPLPLWGGFLTNGHVAGASYGRMRGIEAEIAFRLGRDLPPRDQPYSRNEVIAAIESAHPAVEILESGFYEPDEVDRLSIIGDLQMNGGFAYGPAVANWQSLNLADEQVQVSIDGAVRFEGKGSNTAGTDLLRLVTYLANEGQARTGGLLAGDFITTGSWSGKTLASEKSEAVVTFSRFGSVQIYFA